jgi:DNA polymerase-3 subunit gamma/tau
MSGKLPLQRKYRPKELKEMYGNISALESLESVLNREEGRPTTYLLHGPSGCGKTTTARIIASIIEGELKEFNISKQGGIKEARKLIDSLRYKSLSGKPRIIILNEVHGGDPKARDNFQNAMLEILEEPPEDVYFILCTTEPDKIMSTILTRCHQYAFTTLNSRLMKVLINDTLKKEEFTKEDIKSMSGVTDKIVKISMGSPRSALSILDGVIDLESIESMEEAVDNLTVDESKMLDLFLAIKNKNNWKSIATILKNIKEEPETVRYAMLGLFNRELLITGDGRYALIIECFKESFMYSKNAGLTQACFMAME